MSFYQSINYLLTLTNDSKTDSIKEKINLKDTIKQNNENLLPNFKSNKYPLIHIELRKEEEEDGNNTITVYTDTDSLTYSSFYCHVQVSIIKNYAGCIATKF